MKYFLNMDRPAEIANILQEQRFAKQLKPSLAEPTKIEMSFQEYMATGFAEYFRIGE